MSQPHFTRREVAKILALLGAAGASWHYWKSYGTDDTEFKNSALTVADTNHPSLEIFVALSAIITLRDNLDKESTERMYAVFMDEPWGPQHIASVYTKMQQKLDNPSQESIFTEGEAWFTSHLLTTWYLGIYYHAQRPTQRVLYEHALMFDALRSSHPVPYIDATGFGNWTQPPETKHG
jgi:hypothetical protein